MEREAALLESIEESNRTAEERLQVKLFILAACKMRISEYSMNIIRKSCMKIIVSCVCDPWNQIGGPSARARRRAANKGRSITCPILTSQQRVAMISKLEDLWKQKKVSTPRRSSRSGRFESMLKMRQGKLTLASSGFMQCSNACFIHIHLLVY